MDLEGLTLSWSQSVRENDFSVEQRIIFLQQYLATANMQTLAPYLRIRSTPDFRGMHIACATAKDLDINAGEEPSFEQPIGVLAQIPETHILADCDVPKFLVSEVDRDRHKWSAQADLMLFLTCLRFPQLLDSNQLLPPSELQEKAMEYARQHERVAERFRDYVNSLPLDCEDTTHLPEPELRQMFGRTNLYLESLRIRAQLHKQVDDLLKPAFGLSLKHWLWARTVYLSRAFPKKLKSGATCSVLLPLIDVFNHNHNTPVEVARLCCEGQLTVPSTAVANISSAVIEKQKDVNIAGPQSTEIQEHSAVLRLKVEGSTFDLQAGQEVFNNYGSKGNEELLMGYGFSVANNPFDRSQLQMTADLSQCQPSQLLEASAPRKKRKKNDETSQDRLKRELFDRKVAAIRNVLPAGQDNAMASSGSHQDFKLSIGPFFLSRGPDVSFLSNDEQHSAVSSFARRIENPDEQRLGTQDVQDKKLDMEATDFASISAYVAAMYPESFEATESIQNKIAAVTLYKGTLPVVLLEVAFLFLTGWELRAAETALQKVEQLTEALMLIFEMVQPKLAEACRALETLKKLAATDSDEQLSKRKIQFGLDYLNGQVAILAQCEEWLQQEGLSMGDEEEEEEEDEDEEEEEEEAEGEEEEG